MVAEWMWDDDIAAAPEADGRWKSYIRTPPIRPSIRRTLSADLRPWPAPLSAVFVTNPNCFLLPSVSFSARGTEALQKDCDSSASGGSIPSFMEDAFQRATLVAW